MSRNARIGVLVAVGLVELILGAYLIPTDLGRADYAHEKAPLIFVHRGGAIRWPQNSLTAVRGALAAGAEGIEIDLVLTRDGVAVLSHDPWVHESLCTRADGSPIGERVQIPERTFAELAGFRCGGVVDPDYPEAETVAEPIARFEDVVALMAGSPSVALYLDLKIEPPHTRPGPDFGPVLFETWRAAGLTNPLWIEGPQPGDIAALKAAAGDVPFVSLISTPPYGTQGGYILKVLVARGSMRLDGEAPVERAIAAGADGMIGHALSIPWSMGVEALKRGQQLVVFGASDADDLERFCAWPVTAIIVDDPAAVRCPKRD